jgi:hypothetical protein
MSIVTFPHYMDTYCARNERKTSTLPTTPGASATRNFGLRLQTVFRILNSAHSCRIRDNALATLAIGCQDGGDPAGRGVALSLGRGVRRARVGV